MQNSTIVTNIVWKTFGDGKSLTKAIRADQIQYMFFNKDTITLELQFLNGKEVKILVTPDFDLGKFIEGTK